MESDVMAEQPKFRVSGPLLAGTTLSFAYEVGSETGIVREKLVNGPLGTRFYENKNDAFEAATDVVHGFLQKKYEAAGKSGSRKQRKEAQENLQALMQELKETARPGDYRGIEFIPSPAREVEGVFLPVDAPIYVIDTEQENPTVQYYRVDDYLYLGGSVIYYQCMPEKAPEDAADFRIASDYIQDEGRVFLPASRGEKTVMFWTKPAALKYLSENMNDENYIDLSLDDIDAMDEDDLNIFLEELGAEVEGDLDADLPGPEMTMG